MLDEEEEEEEEEGRKEGRKEGRQKMDMEVIAKMLSRCSECWREANIESKAHGYEAP